MRRTHILASILALPAAAIAGPLTPPAGPVAPTMKTLQELDARIAVNAQNTPGDNDALPSVYKITQPGSYYLTGPITGQPGKVAIEIAASDVTLDLNGFTVSGGLVGVFAGDIAAGVPVGGVHVRNGFVKDTENFGISLSGSHGGRLEKITASGCAGTGLRIGAAGSMIDCASVGNYRGFDFDAGSTVIACRALDNEENGFLANGSGSTLTDCVADDNAQSGFFCSGATLDGCVALDNSMHGFILLNGSVASRCRAANNGQNGFECAGAAILDRCTAMFNGLIGIRGQSGVRIQGCLANGSAGDGIQVQDGCFVSGNLCTGNGAGQGLTGAGIRMMGSGNQVMDNQVVSNEQAIATAAGAADNFIARNVARGNAQGISAAAGNELAPVVTNPGSNGFSSATPWSNFVY